MNKKKIISLFIFCVVFFNIAAFAEIYKSVDADGVVTYSDQPTSQSQTVTLPTVNISTQTTTNPTNSTNAQTIANAVNSAAKKRIPYTAFKITSPTDQETFQNAESIPVAVSFSPALQLDDKIEFLLDGKVVSKPTTSTTFSIPKTSGNKIVIDRGSHTIQAKIVNIDGEAMATTSSVTVFAHYATIQQQQAR